jgi:hypothetical protein
VSRSSGSPKGFSEPLGHHKVLCALLRGRPLPLGSIYSARGSLFGKPRTLKKDSNSVTQGLRNRHPACRSRRQRNE